MSKPYEVHSPKLASNLGLKPISLPFNVYEGRNVDPGGHLASRLARHEALMDVANVFADVMPMIQTKLLEQAASLSSQFSVRYQHELDNLVKRYQSGRGPIRRMAGGLDMTLSKPFMDMNVEATNEARVAVNSVLGSIADLLKASRAMVLNTRQSGSETGTLVARTEPLSLAPPGLQAAIEDGQRIELLRNLDCVSQKDLERYVMDPRTNIELAFETKDGNHYLRIPMIVYTVSGTWILPIYASIVRDGSGYRFKDVTCGIWNGVDTYGKVSPDYAQNHLYLRPLAYDAVEQVVFPGTYHQMPASMIADRGKLLLDNLKYTLKQLEIAHVSL